MAPESSDLEIAKRGDLALAFGILTILVVLILPLPSLVLDLFLAISITLSILILMTSLFIQAPLEFSSFPTVLLIATMLRLSLNLASTRLILSRGHEGTAAAGHVIECGIQATGGNFAFFTELSGTTDLLHMGFPLAEIGVDGSDANQPEQQD